jgi:hypothetical protein
VTRSGNKELRYGRGDLRARRGPFALRCCGKYRFATEAAALAWMTAMSSTTFKPVVPVRAYECSKGWWHLTSAP